MSIIQEIKNSKMFGTVSEKERALKFMQQLFPEDAKIQLAKQIKGEIGRLGWKKVPEVEWIVQCNLTKLTVRLHLKIIETAIGDIWYLWNGKNYQNLFFCPIGSEPFEIRANKFIKDGGFNRIVCN